jgi:diketogulonate reductase-like aldo/keto reductase
MAALNARTEIDRRVWKPPADLVIRRIAEVAGPPTLVPYFDPEAILAVIPGFLYGTAWKEDDTARCVRDALKAGFRGIDTANQRVHYFEAGVGAALQAAYAEGLVERADLFLQTKFTLPRGQDYRLPYDRGAPLATQLRQSFQGSLEHLHTEWIDSYVLHGPARSIGLTDSDREMWRAIEALHEDGLVAHLGVSNVRLDQLQGFYEGARIKPGFVQNRCSAATLWDRAVRDFCRDKEITYQGFSLLTANGDVLRDARFLEIAERYGKTPAQIVFRFALEVGMLPLTGTTDFQHMREDLAVAEFELDPADVDLIESLAAAWALKG